MALKDFDKCDSNPFHHSDIKSLRLNKFPIRPSGPIASKRTGEIIDDPVIIDKQNAYMDLDSPVKLYHSALTTIKDLGTPAIKVLLYIMFSLGKDEDKIYIGNKGAMEFCGYSAPKDVYKGLVELLDKGIIARSTETYMYHINPNVVFRGNKKKLIRS